jgi:hypothetical protein
MYNFRLIIRLWINEKGIQTEDLFFENFYNNLSKNKKEDDALHKYLLIKDLIQEIDMYNNGIQNEGVNLEISENVKCLEIIGTYIPEYITFGNEYIEHELVLHVNYVMTDELNDNEQCEKYKEI